MFQKNIKEKTFRYVADTNRKLIQRHFRATLFLFQADGKCGTETIHFSAFQRHTAVSGKMRYSTSQA